MSKTQKAIRVLLVAVVVVHGALFVLVGANGAHGQTIPQPDAEYILVSQVWLPVVFGGGE